jgi:cytochrome P450
MRAWLFRQVYGGRMKHLAGIPGPAPRFPLGTAADFIGKRWPWEVCAEYGRTYGGMTLIWLGGSPAIVLNDPDRTAEVLDTRAEDYYKNSPRDAIGPIITTDGLFLSNGEQWKFLRTNSPFNVPGVRDWFARQLPLLRTAVSDAVDRLVGQDVPDLVEAARRFSYDAFSLAAWGRTFGDESYKEFMNLAAVGTNRMIEPPPLQKLPPLDPRYWRDHNRWYVPFEQHVEQTVGNPSPDAPDLLNTVLRAGTKLSPKQLMLELSVSVFFGGVFGPSSALATALLCLNRNPEVLTRLRAELKEKDPLGPGFDLGALESCQTLDHVLRETLRWFPPVPIYFRNTRTDRSVVLGGFPLPPDTVIFLSNYLNHRDPKHWDRAEEWVPDRWANGGVDRDPMGSGYFWPFGRGPRACVGADFAMFYLRLALAVILAKAEVRIDPAAQYKTQYFFAVEYPEKVKATMSRLP